MSTKLDIFLKAFNNAEHTLDIKTVEDGANGTGYFDGLVNLDREGSRTSSKFTDAMGRRGVVYYTDKGNFVMFERYKENDNPMEVITFNAPRWVSIIQLSNSLTKDQLWMFAAHPNLPSSWVEMIQEDFEMWSEHHEKEQ